MGSTQGLDSPPPSNIVYWSYDSFLIQAAYAIGLMNCMLLILAFDLTQSCPLVLSKTLILFAFICMYSRAICRPALNLQSRTVENTEYLIVCGLEHYVVAGIYFAKICFVAFLGMMVNSSTCWRFKPENILKVYPRSNLLWCELLMVLTNKSAIYMYISYTRMHVLFICIYIHVYIRTQVYMHIHIDLNCNM